MSLAFDKKIEWINGYISKCNKVIQEKNTSEAEGLQRNIISVFSPELPKMGAYLDRGNRITGVVDYISNIEILRDILSNYVLNMRSGLYKPFQKEAGISLQQTNTQSSENTFSVTVSLEQTIHYINQLPESALSTDDKVLLTWKLAQISVEKEPESRWEKAKGALKWIADKSVEVGIAALPYIVEALKK